MKTFPKTSTAIVAVSSLIWLAELKSACAQETATATPTSVSLSTVTNVEAVIEANLPAIEATTPIAADSFPMVGNFYSAQCTNWPPLPGNILDLPVWDLGDGYYVLDDLDVDYAGLQAKSSSLSRTGSNGLMQPDDGPPSPGGGGGGGGGEPQLQGYTLPPGLKITPPIFTNSNVSVSIYDQDPSIPYDIYYTTNLASPIVWALVSHGIVGQTNYVFANSFGGSPTVFFIVGSGADTDGDGLSDGYEALVSHTNPFNKDTDGDGMPDGWEIAHGFNPLVSNQPYTPPATTVTITKPTNRTTIY
jgi:Bacterial TSP3 repeat